MFLASRLAGASYCEIGRRFGNRDYTTVRQAVRSAERLMNESGEYAAMVGGIVGTVGGRARG
jgi:chromosomal replication initiation ATPase DnaA